MQVGHPFFDPVLLTPSRLLAACALTLAAVLPSGAQTWLTHPDLAAADGPAPANTWLQVRAEVDVPARLLEVVDAARFEFGLAADSKYWLWINDTLRIREGGLKWGPADSSAYVDVEDLAPYLRSGSNQVAMLVWHFGKDGFSHRNSGQASFLFDDHFFDTRDFRVRVAPPYATDSLGLQPNYRLPESNVRYDARLADTSWRTRPLAALDSLDGWRRAVPAPRQPVRLRPRPIPQWRDGGLRRYLGGHVDGRYVSTGDTLALTLPYNAQVTPFFFIDAPAGGMRVDIRTDNFTGGGPPNVRFTYLTRPGRQAFEVPTWMNGHAVRYHFPAGIRVLGLAYRESGYDTDRAGGFASSDPDLDALWEKAARTLYITMRDTYMDCPDRERAQWWGDVVIELGEAFYAFDARSSLLARKGLRELLAFQRPDSTIYSPVPAGNWDQELPMQMLASVGEFGLWTYVYYAADTALARELYPAVRRYLHVWQVDSSGLVVPRKGGWTWGDWGERKDLYLLYQGWYGLALRGFEQLATLTQNADDAAWARQRHAALTAAVRDGFWRKPEGETPGGYASADFPHAPDDRVQALAVLDGWVTPDQYPALRQNLATVYQASPYMERYVLEALMRMGYGADAVARTKRRYRAMIDSELTTLWEGWGIGAEGFGGGTYNHAWSGGALTVMSQRIAGLEPAEMGWARYRLAPQLSGLDSVSAYAPTPAGELRVSWQQRDEVLHGRVQPPADLPGELLLAREVYARDGRVPEVRVDGARAEPQPVPPGFRVALSPGPHALEIR